MEQSNRIFNRVAIYLRKSRQDIELENNGAEDTLSRHRRRLLEVAQKMNLTILKIYEEVVSGDTIAGRPQMQQLLKDVEDGLYDAVLCHDIDRLGRGGMRDQGTILDTFKWAGVAIITPDKVWDLSFELDEEGLEFRTLGARFEYRMIRKRMNQGRQQSVQSGLFIGHTPPYGYQRIKRQGAKGWILSPIEPEASIVKDIYRWYLGDGCPPIGTSLIVRKLNERGIRSPGKGKDWTPCAVRRILSNQTYCGYICSGVRKVVKTVKDGVVTVSRPRSVPVLYKGLHEPIITEEESHMAIAKLAKNKSRPGPKNVEMTNPLSGLVYCYFCGRSMVRRTYSNGRPPSIMCVYTSCPCVSSDFSMIEDAILDGLGEWLKDFENNFTITQENNVAEIESLESAIAAANAELEKLDQQKQRIYTFLEQGVYTTDVFTERMQALSDEINKTTVQLSDLQKELQSAQTALDHKRKLIPNVKHVLSAYKHCQTAQEKNDLLRAVLDHVEYFKSNRERWGDGSDLKITLFPAFPDKN